MSSLPSDDLAPTNPNRPSPLATVLLEHGHSAVCVGCLAKICASLDPIADPDLGMYLVPALKTIAGGGFSPMPYVHNFVYLGIVLQCSPIRWWVA